MKKKFYETPCTKKIQVNMESCICAASAHFENPNDENGKIEEHKVNSDFGFNFQDQNWDEIN